MTIDLTGKNALVTGASRGIGAAIARALGDSGARVAVHYSKSEGPAEEIAEAAGNGSCSFRADLTQPLECVRLFNEVAEEFATLDILVNNAGIMKVSPLDSGDWISDWDETMAVNLRAVGILCNSAIRHFRKHGGGRIINISSRAAYRGDTEDCLAYAASKGGVVSLGKSIARDFGNAGIVCFTIAPGWVRTDMAQEGIDRYGEDFILDGLALTRLTEPADLAPLITLLASGLADHATGTTIDINAGSYVR